MAGNNLLSMHCYIHRQNLASKKMGPELSEVLSQSIKIVNYIKKNSALNTRPLKALCDEMDFVHQNLLYHSKVCWLSCGELRTSLSTSKFWIRMKNEYPNLHEIAMRFLICFSTTCLCETVFSAMTVLKTKQRNCLQPSDSLRLAVTSINPRINKIMDRKQQQKSH